ncbi:HEPN domain-containing protein [Synechocystis sp. LEGE 06083]|uniref:HEPN domain-containing protein n=1 Tax=Synechocystis sp. LEGE 06083 TaxID=915336 RepID=UPI001881EA9B|nr:HEPN domain-containing protein [Synechocystis sp. LEGE 06083]MBE9194785.1 HEPN domain-containing protein [Synechocystis sp. LEGE 06083]
MKFDWTEYFTLAQDLIKAETNEARQRASISRAYYAAFCIARNYLRDHRNETSKRGENEHQFVATTFQALAHNNPPMREIANDLSRLRQERNQADYNDIVPNLHSRTRLSLKLAQNILNKVTELVKTIELKNQ